MDTLYLGPFSATEVDTIQRAMEAQLENVEDFLDHGMDPTEDDAIAFLVEQRRIGGIIDKISNIKLSR